MSEIIKIAFDAGHGINTPGKQTPDKIKEWTLNDKVRDKVADMMKDYDCEIIHTDNNEGKTDESLSTRRRKYMDAGAKAFVSIHHNAYTGNWNGATGVEVYTDKTPTKADKELAECVYNKLVKYTGLKGRGIKEANFTVINQDKIPAILVEGGFMDGTEDYKVITSDAGQTAYAKAVAEGLVEFLGLKKKASTTKPATNNDFVPFYVKVDKVEPGDVLNIRKEPDADSDKRGQLKHDDPATYTIVEVKNGWGRLKSGAGWINLAYTKKVTKTANTKPTPSPYYPKYTGKSYAVDTILRSIGVPEKFLGSWKDRVAIAQAQGIKNYTGTISQNNKLMELARKGQLKRI